MNNNAMQIGAFQSIAYTYIYITALISRPVHSLNFRFFLPCSVVAKSGETRQKLQIMIRCSTRLPVVKEKKCNSP